MAQNTENLSGPGRSWQDGAGDRWHSGNGWRGGGTFEDQQRGLDLAQKRREQMETDRALALAVDQDLNAPLSTSPHNSGGNEPHRKHHLPSPKAILQGMGGMLGLRDRHHSDSSSPQDSSSSPRTRTSDYTPNPYTGNVLGQSGAATFDGSLTHWSDPFSGATFPVPSSSAPIFPSPSPIPSIYPSPPHATRHPDAQPPLSPRTQLQVAAEQTSAAEVLAERRAPDLRLKDSAGAYPPQSSIDSSGGSDEGDAQGSIGTGMVSELKTDREVAELVNVAQQLGVDGAEDLPLPVMEELVRQRLGSLESIPHEMRVNSGRMPEPDEASATARRLTERLQTYGLRERLVSGDGNCQFRALSDQLFKTSEHHENVRNMVAAQLKENPDLYAAYVPDDYEDYVRSMSKAGEWGDHVTLQAAADAYGAKINLLTSYPDKFLVEIAPRKVKAPRELWLSFWAEVHYNSIYAAEDFPGNEPPKKKWGIF
eukprot:TRINITY_DN38858_c0_g1_i1.p1 TRINITY_DN38858_c0_g1~~TRINITY_DN38858_c0_g1_i1.p1  ORF type:complete len:481 (+),score=88.53 TRINITY_DN38858_c0_g1_i1:647-2089(+)